MYPSNESEYWFERFNEEQRQMQIYYSDIGYFAARPSIIWKPKIYLDDGQWCVLYGKDFQSGVCGFGESPEKAMIDFDKNWSKEIKQSTVVTVDADRVNQIVIAAEYCKKRGAGSGCDRCIAGRDSSLCNLAGVYGILAIKNYYESLLAEKDAVIKQYGISE